MVAPKSSKPTKADSDIRGYQRTTALVIPQRSFQRLAREIALQLKPDFRWQSAALGALQEAAEAFLLEHLEKANFAAHHAGRTTMLPRDVHLVRRIRRQ